GVKKSADIGRIASKHVKVTVSGKNYNTGKDRAVTLSLKKSKIQSQIAAVENMNHVNDKENQNNDVEEMDTQEAVPSWRQVFVTRPHTLKYSPNWRTGLPGSPGGHYSNLRTFLLRRVVTDFSYQTAPIYRPEGPSLTCYTGLRDRKN
ncbi:hypothetical protein L9F63_001027, partial [Diploptera punctata]